MDDKVVCRYCFVARYCSAGKTGSSNSCLRSKNPHPGLQQSFHLCTLHCNDVCRYAAICIPDQLSATESCKPTVPRRRCTCTAARLQRCTERAGRLLPRTGAVPWRVLDPGPLEDSCSHSVVQQQCSKRDCKPLAERAKIEQQGGEVERLGLQQACSLRNQCPALEVKKQQTSSRQQLTNIRAEDLACGFANCGTCCAGSLGHCLHCQGLHFTCKPQGMSASAVASTEQCFLKVVLSLEHVKGFSRLIQCSGNAFIAEQKAKATA